MSSLAWPAARSIRGTAATFLAPLSASRSTHSEIGGRESSIKPPSTARDGFRRRTRSTSSWNSRAPRGSRLPWPTTRSAGPVSFLRAPFFSEMLTVCLTSFLLVIDESVQSRRSDRGPTLRSLVRDRRQAAVYKRVFRFCSPDEADGKPDHERRSHVQLEQLEERRRRVPDDPDGPSTDLFRGEPEASRRARDAELLG